MRNCYYHKILTDYGLFSSALTSKCLFYGICVFYSLEYHFILDCLEHIFILWHSPGLKVLYCLGIVWKHLLHLKGPSIRCAISLDCCVFYFICRVSVQGSGSGLSPFKDSFKCSLLARIGRLHEMDAWSNTSQNWIAAWIFLQRHSTQCIQMFLLFFKFCQLFIDIIFFSFFSLFP